MPAFYGRRISPLGSLIQERGELHPVDKPYCFLGHSLSGFQCSERHNGRLRVELLAGPFPNSLSKTALTTRPDHAENSKSEVCITQVHLWGSFSLGVSMVFWGLTLGGEVGVPAQAPIL